MLELQALNIDENIYTNFSVAIFTAPKLTVQVLINEYWLPIQNGLRNLLFSTVEILKFIGLTQDFLSYPSP